MRTERPGAPNESMSPQPEKEQNRGCISILLNMGTYRPGFYVYLGRYRDDRDIKILGWRGPWKSKKEAKQEIPDWWEYEGFDKPRVRFRFSEPLLNFHPGISDQPLEK